MLDMLVMISCRTDSKMTSGDYLDYASGGQSSSHDRSMTLRRPAMSRDVPDAELGGGVGPISGRPRPR